MAVEVKTKTTHIVKPAEKTWTGTMKLSEIDMRIAKGYVPKIYLYKPNNNWNSDSISKTLKDSLGKVLVHFYPFAGRLRLTGGGRMDLDVDDSADTWGVPVVEAEADVEVADFGDDLLEAEAKGTFQSLFSMVDFEKPLDELPLLSIKITHFRCGGVAVAITWSHVVVDGLGAGHFYTEWTRFARGESLGMAPVHDRSFLRAGELPRPVPEFIQRDAPPPPPPSTPMILPPNTDGSEVDTPPTLFPTTTTVKLTVSKSHIDKLKQTAGYVVDGRPYSRFEVLTAHAWRCASKARGHEGKKLNALGMAIDIRKRINPPLPKAFNGNGAIVMTATSESEDLITNPLGYACDKIRQTIDKVTPDLIWAYMDYQKSLDDLWAWRGIMTPEGIFVNPDIVMVSWMNLSFNNLDFGWGNEIFTAAIPQSWEGVGCLLSGHEDGSAIVVMCLQDTHVDKFKDIFFHELE